MPTGPLPSTAPIFSCPQCHTPVRAGDTVCRACGINLALAAVLAAGLPRAAAQTYLGEFCWWVTDTIGGDLAVAAFRLKAGVTHLGGAYYLLQGRVARPDTPLFLQATGVIIGDEVWLNGTTTQGLHEGSIMQARLNLPTLDGTFWRIETDVISTDGFNASVDQRYITGALWSTTCP